MKPHAIHCGDCCLNDSQSCRYQHKCIQTHVLLNTTTVNNYSNFQHRYRKKILQNLVWLNTSSAPSVGLLNNVGVGLEIRQYIYYRVVVIDLHLMSSTCMSTANSTEKTDLRSMLPTDNKSASLMHPHLPFLMDLISFSTEHYQRFRLQSLSARAAGIQCTKKQIEQGAFPVCGLAIWNSAARYQRHQLVRQDRQLPTSQMQEFWCRSSQQWFWFV